MAGGAAFFAAVEAAVAKVAKPKIGWTSVTLSLPNRDWLAIIEAIDHSYEMGNRTLVFLLQFVARAKPGPKREPCSCPRDCPMTCETCGGAMP